MKSIAAVPSLSSLAAWPNVGQVTGRHTHAQTAPFMQMAGMGSFALKQMVFVLAQEVPLTRAEGAFAHMQNSTLVSGGHFVHEHKRPMLT